MELKIRNVDPTIVKKIDELAKKKKVSRSEYLRNLIETHGVKAEIEKNKKETDELLTNLSFLIRQNTEALNNIYDMLDDGGGET